MLNIAIHLICGKPTKHQYIGVELDMGTSLFNTYDGNKAGSELLIQSAIRAGYRF